MSACRHVEHEMLVLVVVLVLVILFEEGMMSNTLVVVSVSEQLVV